MSPVAATCLPPLFKHFPIMFCWLPIDIPFAVFSVVVVLVVVLVMITEKNNKTPENTTT